MNRVRLLWVDVGMGLAVVVYLGVAIFLRDAEFVGLPVMAWYMAALLIWAGYAEVAAVIAEQAKWKGIEPQPPVPVEAAQQLGNR